MEINKPKPQSGAEQFVQGFNNPEPIMLKIMRVLKSRGNTIHPDVELEPKTSASVGEKIGYPGIKKEM